MDKQFPYFFERWKGTVLAAEKTAGLKNKENEKMLSKEQQKRRLVIAAFGLLSLLAISGFILAKSILLVALLLTTTAGIFISWLIITKDLGIENRLADRVCGATEDCNAVIKSNTVKLPGGLSWGDIGLTWFSFQFLIVMVSLFAGTTTQITMLFSLCSIFYLPFSVFSIYYQWSIAKKWCRLCLLVIGILIVQATILIPPLMASDFILPGVNSMLLAALLLGTTTLAWLAIKELVKSNQQLQTANGGLQRFKNNAEIFIWLLKQQRKVDTTPWENDLQLGNPVAEVQILVACSPYCGPCANAHKMLHELVETNKELGLTVRFTINASGKEDKNTKAIEYVFQLIAEKQVELTGEEIIAYKREMLHNWFEWMDSKKFEDNYSLRTKSNVDKLLVQQDVWSKEANINATPTIFVNGYELPKVYSIADVGGLVRGIKEDENTAEPATMEVI